MPHDTSESLPMYPPPTSSTVDRFLEAVHRLPLQSWVTALEIWTGIPFEAWIAAEQALAAAIETAGRRAFRDQIAARARQAAEPIAWLASRYPVAKDAVQLMTVNAALALLVWDQLDPASAEVLYQAFAPLIPLASLRGS